MTKGTKPSGIDPEKPSTSVHPDINAALGELIEVLKDLRQEPEPQPEPKPEENPVARFGLDVLVGLVTAALLWIASSIYVASSGQQPGPDDFQKSTEMICEEGGQQ